MPDLESKRGYFQWSWIRLVPQKRNSKPKLAVARHLDVVAPPKGSTDPSTMNPPSTPGQDEAPSNEHSNSSAAAATAAAATCLVHQRTTSLTTVPEQPTDSLEALRLFNQNQARRHRAALSAARRQRAAAQKAQVQCAVPPVIDVPQVQANMPSPIALSGFHSNQGDLSLPSDIAGCSNTSTNDSLRSLLNAFMVNAPASLEQVSQEQMQQYCQEQHQQLQQPVVNPSESLYFTQVAGATADIVQSQEDSSSSLSRFIHNLTAGNQTITTDTPVEVVNLDDSLQQKICREMMQPPSSSSMDLPIHPVYNAIPSHDTFTHGDAPPAAMTTDQLVSPQIDGEDTFDLFRNQVSL
ncbi:hypothetical protein Aperf_G00000061379 [Anoplocephala perfoliata]